MYVTSTHFPNPIMLSSLQLYMKHILSKPTYQHYLISYKCLPTQSLLVLVVRSYTDHEYMLNMECFIHRWSIYEMRSQRSPSFTLVANIWNAGSMYVCGRNGRHNSWRTKLYMSVRWVYLHHGLAPHGLCVIENHL